MSKIQLNRKVPPLQQCIPNWPSPGRLLPGVGHVMSASNGTFVPDDADRLVSEGPTYTGVALDLLLRNPLMKFVITSCTFSTFLAFGMVFTHHFCSNFRCIFYSQHTRYLAHNICGAMFAYDWGPSSNKYSLSLRIFRPKRIIFFSIPNLSHT
jgi:hypothetical protein